MTASPSATATIGTGSPAITPAPTRRVVDAPTRMFHWLFAATFLGAYLTAESEHWRLLHVTLGYTFAGLLGFRLLYGLFGPRQAGLGLRWRRVAGAPAWLRSLGSARSLSAVNWRQGQNLAVALAIVAMLALVVPLVLSGYGTYDDWGGLLGGRLGGDWLEETHEFFGNAFLMVVLAHVGLIAVLSVLRRQNQALPMLTGRARGAGPSLVQHNRAWLACLLLLAVVGFGAWQWRDSPRGLMPARDAASASHAQAVGKVHGKRHDADDDCPSTGVMPLRRPRTRHAAGARGTGQSNFSLAATEAWSEGHSAPARPGGRVLSPMRLPSRRMSSTCRGDVIVKMKSMRS